MQTNPIIRSITVSRSTPEIRHNVLELSFSTFAVKEKSFLTLFGRGLSFLRVPAGPGIGGRGGGGGGGLLL